MSMRVKLLLVAAATIAVLGGAVGAGGARNLNVSVLGFRSTWTRMSMSGNARVECPVTLEGSFHSATMHKVAEASIGSITRAIVNTANCAGGIFYALNGTERLEERAVGASLPWDVRYEGFTGTLPDIAGLVVRVVGVSFLLAAIETHCLYRSTVAEPAFATISITANSLANWRWKEERRIPINSEGLCEPTAELSGAGSTIALTGGGALVSIRLI